MKKFLEQDHLGGGIFLVLGAVLNWPLLGVFLDERMEGRSGMGPLLLMVLVAALAGVLFFRQKRLGLYFEGEEMVRRSLFGTRRIPLDAVVAIKVAKEAVRQKDIWEPYLYITDEEGNPLYRMFFLKDVGESIMRSSANSSVFASVWGQETLCGCVYDQSMIDYMKERNPSLLVIPPEGLTEEEILSLRKPIERIPGPVRGWVGKTRMKE